jgi:undecaprenyl-diphosphatase
LVALGRPPFGSERRLVDKHVYDWINRLADHTGWAHPLFIGIAKNGIVVFALLLAGAYVDGRRRRDVRGMAAAVWAAAAVFIALAVGQLIGHVVERARPYTVMPSAHVLIARSSDFSFPSDHATAAAAVAAGLLLAGRRRWGIAAVVAACAMAFARVYVGVHFPGDVLAGLALGAVVAVLGGFIVVPLVTRALDAVGGSPLRRLVVGPQAEGTKKAALP